MAKVHKSVGFGRGNYLGWFYFSSPLHCKVTAYLPEKQCVSTEKVKYPRIFNEISMDT